MIKKITLGLLATIGALSIILVSYSYFIKKREEGKGVTDNSKSNQLTESERLKIWEKGGSRYAAEYSQRLVEREINDQNYTASTGVPVHKKGADHFVIDGILQKHDGTGRYLNYSCVVGCSLLSDPREEDNWNCYDLYVDGKNIMTSWERLPMQHAINKYSQLVADRAGIATTKVTLNSKGHSLYHLLLVTQRVMDKYHVIQMFKKDSAYIFNKIDSAMLTDPIIRSDMEQDAKRSAISTLTGKH